jgi:ATP-dependent Clp protease ATP-binding subunit ClpC
MCHLRCGMETPGVCLPCSQCLPLPNRRKRGFSSAIHMPRPWHSTRTSSHEEGHAYMQMIDEVHTLIGAGAAEGAIDAANILKPALARGELQCLGATTLDEYRKHIEKDPALERRFQPVTVPEPSVEEAYQILLGLRERYEAHHKLRYRDEALQAAATYSHQYISDRFLPDKAIDLIDEAGSRVRLRHAQLPEAAREVEKELRKIQKEKDESVRAQEFEKAGEFRDKEMELKAKIDAIVADKQAEDKAETEAVDGGGPFVEEADIANIVAQWTGIPVEKVSADETERLINMESVLHSRVIGQEEAVVAISRAIRRARVGLKNPDRPIASFIFSGPTGVGKSELAKTLAAYYFGSEEAMVRLDMSEYMERHTVAKLIGSPPGYVGYNEGGQLTEAVRRRPYTVVLFDEIEKAHPDVFNMMLQILEDGRLTDSKGRTVDFKNTLIIMTSNVGSSVIEKGGGGLGFQLNQESEEENSYNRIKNLVCLVSQCPCPPAVHVLASSDYRHDLFGDGHGQRSVTERNALCVRVAHGASLCAVLFVHQRPVHDHMLHALPCAACACNTSWSVTCEQHFR